jgi:DNA processing protein
MTLADDELAAWLRLHRTHGISRGVARRLLAAFGSPQAVFSASPAALREVVSPLQSQALSDEPEGWRDGVEATRAWLAEAPQRRLLVLGDADYPRALLETADPPLLMFAQGRVGLAQQRSLAIVGSRRTTPQGEDHARAFAQHLAGAGLVIVSGLASGVDGAAHEGALAGGGATIAVVGTGLDRVYPPSHRELAHRIASEGLLLSEYPLGTPPLADNFPLRNRIIAGLSLGTLVVEAALQSGSLITARLALECGREVFAIPGSIHSPQSRGCHALIKQGAKLVESAEDILEELQPGSVSAAAASDTSAEASPTDDPVLRALGHDPATLDALQGRTGLPTHELQARLLELELTGQASRLPGGLYQRRSSA